jgi:hypothetical protein
VKIEEEEEEEEEVKEPVRKKQKEEEQMKRRGGRKQKKHTSTHPMKEQPYFSRAFQTSPYKKEYRTKVKKKMLNFEEKEWEEKVFLGRIFLEYFSDYNDVIQIASTSCYYSKSQWVHAKRKQH